MLLNLLEQRFQMIRLKYLEERIDTSTMTIEFVFESNLRTENRNKNEKKRSTNLRKRTKQMTFVRSSEYKVRSSGSDLNAALNEIPLSRNNLTKSV